MSISDKDLFLAVLSMDAYNRGYSPGIAIAGTQIGNATFTLGSDQQAAGIPEGVAAGFYAAANDTQWGTVISYRGTDLNLFAPWSDGPGSDMWNGYGTAAGKDNSVQVQLAAEFFQSASGMQNAHPRSGSITLTGHSLGGGLSGTTGTNDNLINILAAA